MNRARVASPARRPIIGMEHGNRIHPSRVLPVTRNIASHFIFRGMLGSILSMDGWTGARCCDRSSDYSGGCPDSVRRVFW